MIWAMADPQRIEHRKKACQKKMLALALSGLFSG
jgi:hypothetical protein